MTSKYNHVVCLISIAIITILSLYKNNDNTSRKLEWKKEESSSSTIQVQGIRAFEQWDRSKTPFPCSPTIETSLELEEENTQGIFYIKVPKTSSSTMAHITNRIAGREAKRQGLGEGTTCKIHDPMKHIQAYDLNLANRDKLKSFLWSMVRHPSDRAISHFGMRVNFGQVQPTKDEFMKLLNSAFEDNIELRFLYPSGDPNTEINKDTYQSAIDSILTEFNFIGVYERLHESLVVLSMILDVSVSDVLFDFLPKELSRCNSLQRPNWVQPDLETYLNSTEWKQREEGDFLLYDAINQSLDLTIQKLGKENVKKRLDQYRKILHLGRVAASRIHDRIGCGVPGLHERHFPFADIKDVPFVMEKLSKEEQEFLSSPQFNVNPITKPLVNDETKTSTSKNKNGLIIKGFEPWDKSKNPFPCYPSDSPNTRGIYYIKVPKTSSSTLARITQRIAGRQAQRQGYKNGESCKIHDAMKHYLAFDLNCGNRDKDKSFLWSVIRHPSDRVISHFGMRVKFGQMKPTDQAFKQLISTVFDSNVELKFLSPFVDAGQIKEDAYPTIVQDILNEFNFIGIYERLHESLVVLSMILDIDITDVLFDFLPSTLSRCNNHREKPVWFTEGMESYLNSSIWRQREKGDYMFYDAVNESLDKTIDKLGRKNVENKLKVYNKILHIGTAAAFEILNRKGCGVPGLHWRQTPFANVKDLFWVKSLKEQDRDYVSMPEFNTVNTSLS